MSVSTNAILFYGYCWSEEGQRLLPEIEDGDSEWPLLVLRRRGVPDPWDTYPSARLESLPYEQKCAAGDAWRAEHRAELDAWREARRAVEKEFGVKVGAHCSGEYPIPYLAIAGMGKMARRGYPEAVTPLDLAIFPDWNPMLDRFLAEFGLARPHDLPQWWLVSYWG